MNVIGTKAAQDAFENALVAELQELHKAELSLQRLYHRLADKPQLRTQFVRKLSDVQQRANRLDVFLSAA